MSSAKPGEGGGSTIKAWIDDFKTVIWAIVFALGIRTFAYEPFNIPSESMLPNLLVGDYLFVSKYSYGYSKFSFPLSVPLFQGRIMEQTPKRGDVAVFRLPRDEKVDYIKRIIGLPGDRIQMRDGELFINGEKVARRKVEDFRWRDPSGIERRATQYVETLPGGRSFRTLDLFNDSTADSTGVYEVPAGHYFAMGDNRDNSLDSRVSPALGGVGFIPAANLIGRAETLFYSVDGNPPIYLLWKWVTEFRGDRFLKSID